MALYAPVTILTALNALVMVLTALYALVTVLTASTEGRPRAAAAAAAFCVMRDPVFNQPKSSIT